MMNKEKAPIIASTFNQFISFILVGALAAFLNFSSRILFSLFAPFAVAIVLSFFVGLLSAFIMCKLYVFRAGNSGMVIVEFLLFTAVNLAGLAQTLAVSLLLANYALPFFSVDEYRYEIAHGFGVCVPIVTSFLGHKLISFRKRGGKKCD